MGCVSAKLDINDQHPNIFQVTNVNDLRERVSPGQLEVTESELVLYQRGKTPTVWPLKSLRKYGLDAEIFSFECGRRCPTGEGIYAFYCRRAEHLFNMVQQNITRNVGDDGLNLNVISSGNSEFPLSIVSTGPAVQRRVTSQSPEGYLAPLHNANSIRTHPNLSRPGSVSSNGPVSPTASSPPPIEVPTFEHNNNKRGSLVSDHFYTNSNALLDGESRINYANLGLTPQSSLSTPMTENYVNIQESVSHSYMNITTTKDSLQNTKEKFTILETEEDTRHCYANIDTKEVETLRTLKRNFHQELTESETTNSIYVAVRKVNYAKLDFNAPGNSYVDSQSFQPESPTKESREGYAVIDFNRTNALSQSVNPKIDDEEGSRKTRHNSSICEVMTRTNSFLSD